MVNHLNIPHTEVIKIINYNDTVETTWTASNMNYYINLGYTYTKTGDKFKVKIIDLPNGSHIKYPIICDVCKNVFYSNNNSLKRSLNTEFHTCKNCKQIKMANTRIKSKLDDKWKKLQDACESKGYKLITTKDQYVGSKKSIYYECPKHGIKSSTYNNLVRGAGCNECAKKIIYEKQRNSKEKIINYISSINNNTLLNPDDYIKAGEPNLNILCGLCGENTFTTSFINYKNGTNRCAKCRNKMSRCELEIKNILDKYNINYKQEYTFKDCRDKLPLPFDFYLYDFNKCIEFDGEQHYNINYDITMKAKDPVLAFETRKLHDKIKTQYCQNNNIGLLRIPYWEKNHIEKIIINELGIFK